MTEKLQDAYHAIEIIRSAAQRFPGILEHEVRDKADITKALSAIKSALDEVAK